MDNYKLLTISILHLKHDKDSFFLFFCHEDMLENILGFGCMHENKTFFFLFFLLKREINLKIVYRNISEKVEYFNTEFVSYSVKIQPNIKQNW